MKKLPLILFCSFLLLPGIGRGASDWYWKGSGQLLLKSYNGSMQLDNLTGIGATLSGDYLERGGVSVGLQFNQTDYKPAASNGLNQIDESILYLSGRMNFHPDSLPGRLSVRLDSYLGNDALQIQTTTSGGGMGGGSSNNTETIDDKFSVINPIISFLNYSKTYYVDLGYAFSHYRSDDDATDDIEISQWTPTLGFGFNQAYDWLQLRGYLIQLSNSNRVQDKDATSALELKWIHWYSAEAPLNLHSTRLSLLAGERIYAVDSDACSLCNVPDLQTGAMSVSAEWKLSEQTSVLLHGAYEAYKNLLINDRYNSNILFLSITQQW